MESARAQDSDVARLRIKAVRRNARSATLLPMRMDPLEERSTQGQHVWEADVAPTMFSQQYVEHSGCDSGGNEDGVCNE
eukprot:3103717-Pleurochrysis_carterae.AAC.1